MKNLIVTTLLVIGMASFAQEKPQRPEKGNRAEMEKFTPEQRNELRIKKLTLDLDLNASQQKEMAKLIAEADAKREAARAGYKAQKETDKKLSTDEKFALRSKMLDEQIAFKEKVKKILNPEQMIKWEKMQERRKFAMGKMRKHANPKQQNQK